MNGLPPAIAVWQQKASMIKMIMEVIDPILVVVVIIFLPLILYNKNLLFIETSIRKTTLFVNDDVVTECGFLKKVFIDFRVKCCIKNPNSKNNSTGRSACGQYKKKTFGIGNDL